MSISEAPFSARWSVGGVRFRVEWDDAALTEPMEATLSYFGSALENSDACEAHVRLFAHAPPLALPTGAERLSVSREGLQFYRSGDALYLQFRGTTVRVDPERGTAYGTLAVEGEDAFEDLGEPLRNALVYCLFYYSAVALLYHRGLRTVHAACLAWEGHGCLIVGESDSGKSTLTMRMIEAGWEYLTDDAVLLGQRDGHIEARPLRRDFCLDPEAEALFPQVAAHWQPHLADVRKRRLRIRSLYPEQAAPSCVPRSILFPRIATGQAESRLDPLGQKPALVGLLQHTGALAVLDASTAAGHLGDLKQLTDQARSYSLAAGLDLRDDPQAAVLLTRRLLGAEITG